MTLKRKILIGDVLEQFKNIPDGSVDTIVSSPPYWGLRDYGEEGQWGLEKDFREYLDKLDAVMKECWRVLKPTGSCWINLGDTYSTLSGGMKDLKRGVKKKYGQVDYGVGHAHTGDDNPERASAFSVDQANMYKGLQSKSRVGIPERFYIRCIDNGWIARNHIPWIKANSMPSSVRDRFTNKWESVFFFVKQKKYYFNLDAVRETPKSGFDKKPFNRRIRDAKRLKQQGLDGVIVGAKMSDKEESTTDKNGNRKGLETLRQKEGLAKHGFVAKHDYGLHERRENGEEVNNCNPKGKNPGDVFRIKVSEIEQTTIGEPLEDRKYAKVERATMLGRSQSLHKAIQEARDTGSEHDTGLNNPSGKNPGDVIYDKSKPYAVVERKGIVFYRNLPPHDEIRKYLSEARKKENLTIKQVQEKVGKTAHHWFENANTPRSTPSFPSVEEWAKLKKILKLDDKHDEQMLIVLEKDAVKIDNKQGKNPGDVFQYQELTPYYNEKHDKFHTRQHDNNPAGKNPGDIFEINTRPFAKAHFATFPPALPEKILKASCPKQVCKKCGQPREEITEVESMSQIKVVGYKECDCKAGFEAGTVLDPFFGAGTVAIVAEELSLNWIGVELKKEYADIATERLKPYITQHKIGEIE